MTNVAVDKEKVEKRRALGRGLESLLPGPRVVANQASGVGRQAAGVGHQTSDLGPPTLGGGRQAPTESQPAPGVSQQVPHRIFDSVRNDSVVGGAVQEVGGAVQEVGAAVQEVGGSGWEGPYSDETAEAGDGPISIQAVADTRVPPNLVLNLAITDIDKNPFQTRQVVYNDGLEELAKSIKANGVVQPIVVRPAKEEGRFVLILGERRIHASKKAGKTHIPAIVRKVSTQQAAEMTIVENLQRDDLSPMEHAEAFRILSTEFNLSQAQIGQRVGLSRESVANYMRLLKLPQAVIDLLANRTLTFSKAKELMKIDDDVQMAGAATYAAKHGMTIEEIQTLVTRLELGGAFLEPVERMSSGARWVDPNVRAAQAELQRILGLRVKIQDRKGKGKIVIEYSTVDDYDRVVGMLSGKES